MARIYKLSDRIPVQIDDVRVKIAPLSVDQKTEIQQLMFNGRLKNDLRQLTQGTVLAVKYGLKSIEGIEDADGNPYQLSFEDNQISDECIQDLMNMGFHKKLVMVCTSLLGGVPHEFADDKGQKLEGVEIIRKPSESAEKN